jgi:hypothetical protein
VSVHGTRAPEETRLLETLRRNGWRVWQHSEGGWSAEKGRFGYWGRTPHDLLRRVLDVKHEPEGS